ncbi:MAG: hypothetical protein A3D31_05730 [Candidatus Fluviicola riflensis]|nr:MAG: hypothetical protein CHH17_09285 [Candidatus Fluviicola riflensis]OGS79469.1 MAG: hypothetical protein A3D31_05730 [Candidatus Fluviicola riflensis]OGS86900.1 MAG: hypothetical protein A2724_05190 [Fluviicola sp. RIFCSPHIGHO2_01_FULL_43_53]OGS89691.1 MAG: hypothetical protein A3E30_01935 [Fluviicola sp. RIFCSPHIGHO2_12_FULL_43_24]
MTQVDDFFLKQQEPVKSCLLALKSVIQNIDPEIELSLRYGMPFFILKGKRFCYLWIHKKYRQPYIGFVDGNQMNHPELLQEDRTRMKILLIDPEKDIPVELVELLVEEAMKLL